MRYGTVSSDFSFPYRQSERKNVMKNIIRTTLLASVAMVLATGAMAQNYDASRNTDQTQGAYPNQSSDQNAPPAERAAGRSPAGSHSTIETSAGNQPSTASSSTSSAVSSPAKPINSASAKLNTKEVRDLQQSLDNRGYDPGSIDGIIGQQTANAIRKFQQDNSLRVTGTATNETLTRLGLNTYDANGSSFNSDTSVNKNTKNSDVDRGSNTNSNSSRSY
jgi:hypothetical protein